MALPYATENQLKLLEQKTKYELDRKTANINLTADTLDDMNALITKGSVGDGQLCYCKENKKLYVLKDNVWSEVGGGGGIPVVEGTVNEETMSIIIPEAQTSDFILHIADIGGYLYMSVFDEGYGCYMPLGNIIYVFSGTETTIKVSISNSLENVQGSSGAQISVTSPGILSIDNTTNYLYSVIGGKLTTGLYSSVLPGLYVSYYTDSENKLQGKFSYLHDSKIVPLFTKYNILMSRESSETEILPCTTSDNGKVLTVVNGEAQWSNVNVGDTIDNTSPSTSALGRITIKVGHYTVGQKLSISVNIPYNENHLNIPATAHGKEVVTADDVVFLTSFSFDGDNKLMYANLICIKEGDVATERTPFIYGTFYTITKSK